MDVHEPAEGMREERGGPEKKRRFLDERLAGERRHQPVVRLEDLVDEAEAVGLIGLPRIVAEEARQDPRGDERADRDGQCRTGPLKCRTLPETDVSTSNAN